MQFGRNLGVFVVRAEVGVQRPSIRVARILRKPSEVGGLPGELTFSERIAFSGRASDVQPKETSCASSQCFRSW